MTPTTTKKELNPGECHWMISPFPSKLKNAFKARAAARGVTIPELLEEVMSRYLIAARDADLAEFRRRG